jgi:hypothetical protein
MRQAARSKGNRTQVSGVTSLPAPIGGLNSRDSLAAMAQTDAVVMENFFPATTECVLRKGYVNHVTGITGQVETLMVYSANTEKMFAIAGGKVYDVSSSGAVGAAALTGLTNSRWQYCNFSTAGGNFLSMGNGVDAPRLYDGTSWSTPAITGVTTTKLNTPIVFKNRQYFIEKGTLKTWYLPVQSIAGAANKVDMSAVAKLGGYIVAHETWTIDAGTGVDDYYVAITNHGEVIVYQGTDPSDAATWALKGVWRIGAPVGDRCMFKLAGDILVICQDGLMPLGAALQSSRVNPRVALTDKIQWSISEDVTTYGANFGWQIFYYPSENQLWMNIPQATGGTQYQYAMNTISRSWGKYTGYNANTFQLFNEEAYFGGDGFVGKAWFGNSDAGLNIRGKCLQAFSTYGAAGRYKRFTMTRPIFRATGTPSVKGSMNYDFNVDIAPTDLNFAPNPKAVWGSAIWGQAIWGGGYSIYQDWQGVSGLGYYAAPQIQAVTNGVDVRWVSTDVVFEQGQIL